MLLNLAEEPEIEKKMAKRGIVGYLCKMLARSNTELLVLALIFLKKLAIFKENLPEMRREKLVGALVGFVPHHTEAVLVSALRLLYNLSFDAHQRDAIIASPLLTKAVGLVRKRMQLPIVLRLAYNLSSTEKGRKALGATDLPAIVRKHVLACAELELPAELAALAINLACDKAGAEALSDGGALDQLVDRLLQTQDAMLMKLLRNLCAHDACGRQMLRRAGELFALTRQVDTPELLVELLGCLGALPVDELADVAQLVAGYELLDFAQRHMVPGFTDDDVLLEVIVLVGGLARNQTVATQIARTRLMAALYSLITEKQEDDEFVLQVNGPRFSHLPTPLLLPLLTPHPSRCRSCTPSTSYSRPTSRASRSSGRRSSSSTCSICCWTRTRRSARWRASASTSSPRTTRGGRCR